MAVNPYYNKVSDASGRVYIDLTGDTVDAGHLLYGSTAHDASGAVVTGAYVPRKEPIAYDFVPGYVSNGQWIYENSTNNRTDVYEVVGGHEYILMLGNTAGTRWRGTVVASNPVDCTSGRISGQTVCNTTSPKARQAEMFTANTDGYLAITKDNAGTSGLVTYLVELTIE